MPIGREPVIMGITEGSHDDRLHSFSGRGHDEINRRVQWSPGGIQSSGAVRQVPWRPLDAMIDGIIVSTGLHYPGSSCYNANGMNHVIARDSA